MMKNKLLKLIDFDIVIDNVSSTPIIQAVLLSAFERLNIFNKIFIILIFGFSLIYRSVFTFFGGLFYE